MPGENGDVYNEQGRYDPQCFAAKSAGKRIIVLCAGVIMNFLLAIVLFSVAYTQGEPTFPAVIGTVEPGSPAQAAGLRPNDTITSIDGHPIKLFQDVVTLVDQGAALVKGHQQRFPVVLTIQRPGVAGTLTVTVNARVNPPANKGRMGVGGKVVFVSLPLWQAPIKGIVQTFDTTRLFIVSIEQMIVGAIHPRLMGPVGIVQLTGEVAQSTPDLGWWPILNLTAMLSLNLAVVNILPFPALDGGRVLLILIEIVRGGKRLKPEREGIINLVGMALLLTLMVVITVSDVLHWGS
jgi:regulator of sigma E protease